MNCYVFVAAMIALCSASDVLKVRDSPCVQHTDCTCQTDSGFIDLRPLANDSILRANAPLLLQSFEFNPCSTFTHKTCKNVLMCEHVALTNQYQAVGTANNVDFINYETSIALFYRAGRKKATVTLNCDEKATKPEFVFGNESPTQHYYFILTTMHACENTNITTSVGPSTSHTSSPATTHNTTSPTPTTQNTTTPTTQNTTTPATHNTTTPATSTPTTNNTTVTSHRTTNNTTPHNTTATSTPTKPTTTPKMTTTPRKTTSVSTSTTTQGAGLLRSSPVATVVGTILALKTLFH